MTTYSLSHSQPGYAPDEVLGGLTAGEARVLLADTIERHWDEDYQGAANEGERLSVDARYLEPHTEVALIALPGSVHVPGEGSHGMGRTYFVEEEEQ